MPRRRSEDKRKRILRGGLPVFARRGYFTARVADIRQTGGGCRRHDLPSTSAARKTSSSRLSQSVMSEHIVKGARRSRP